MAARKPRVHMPSPHPLSRREFLRSLALLGGAAVTVQVLSACGGTAPATTAPTTAAPAGAAPTAASAEAAPTAAPAQSEPAAGGELRFGQNNEPDTLDPARTAQASAFTIMMNIYDT